MAARLGNVVYWLGLAIAVLTGLSAAFYFYLGYVRDQGGLIVAGGELLATVSFGSFLIGRAARYILAGR